MERVVFVQFWRETFSAESAHTVIGYHCPHRPSREEARWWRRLLECEKGKENGGAGDRALGRSVIMLVSKTVTVKTYNMYHGEFVIIEKAYVVDRMGLGIRTYRWQ